MTPILIATRNAHKVEEIQAVLGANFGYWTLRDFAGVPEVVEDARSFAGNARKKSIRLASWLVEAWRHGFSLPLKPAALCYVLADDSGLEVDALQGAPGIHSARFAALDSGGQANAPDDANNAKLLSLTAGIAAPHRTARFRCVIAATRIRRTEAADNSAAQADVGWRLQTELFEGVCEGQLGESARGRGGFGYDPLFIPAGYQETFAELGERAKNQMSHRARALAKLRSWLTS